MRTLDLILISSLIPVIVCALPKEKTDPCLDREELDLDPNTLLRFPLKYANLTPPWIREDGSLSKMIGSNGFIYHWMWMKSLYVKGLGKSVNDVMDFLSGNNCFFVAIGESVRQAILGQRRVSLSGEVSCDLHELHEKCLKKYGPIVCSLYPTEDEGFRLEIGDASGNYSTDRMRAEPIVLYEWRTIIGKSPDNWRYTVDSLAVYDNGFGIIAVIDPLDNGFDHVCDRKLVPTHYDWDDWSLSQPMKALGFYELLSNGFSAKNQSFHIFVRNEVNATDMKTLLRFYCESVLKGIVDLSENIPICHRRKSNRQKTKKIEDIKVIMIRELGPLWNSTIGKAANDMATVYHTDRQLIHIRSRLLRKVYTTYVERTPEDLQEFESVTEEPKVIAPPTEQNFSTFVQPVFNISITGVVLPTDPLNETLSSPDLNDEWVVLKPVGSEAIVESVAETSATSENTPVVAENVKIVIQEVLETAVETNDTSVPINEEWVVLKPTGNEPTDESPRLEVVSTTESQPIAEMYSNTESVPGNASSVISKSEIPMFWRQFFATNKTSAFKLPKNFMATVVKAIMESVAKIEEEEVIIETKEDEQVGEKWVYATTVPHDTVTPVESEFNYTHYNNANEGVPVMQFEPVDEEEMVEVMAMPM